jgi:perosamine synthetase
MTTGEGGMITTDDEAVADRARVLRAHGMRQRYYHERLGYNFRMTDVQAALGLAQLDRLPSLTARRQANAVFLSSALADLPDVFLPRHAPGYEHVYHQFTIRVPLGRDAFREGMTARGVGTEVYYPRSIPQQDVYRELGYNTFLPITETTAREVVSLPIHPALSPAELEQIAWAVSDTVDANHDGVWGRPPALGKPVSRRLPKRKRVMPISPLSPLAPPPVRVEGEQSPASS